MELSATYTFNAPREKVWALLTDPDVVASCLPGCDGLEPTGEHSYRATLTVGIAAISGTYQGNVTIADQAAPERYRLIVDGTGRAGFVKGEADVILQPADGGRTIVDVQGRGQVGGTIARVGQRLLGSVSKTMMNKFFDCVGRRAES
jgi:carbon monoxide dehydrogenase subunit G